MPVAVKQAVRNRSPWPRSTADRVGTTLEERPDRLPLEPDHPIAAHAGTATVRLVPSAATAAGATVPVPAHGRSE